MRITKKCWPEYFEAMAAGKKNFEYRLDDFNINEGDTLILKEWDPENKDYTGRELEKQVTYVGVFDLKNSFWPTEDILEKGIKIISLK